MPAITFARLLVLNHTNMSPMADSAIVDIKEPEFCRAIVPCGYKRPRRVSAIAKSLRY